MTGIVNSTGARSGVIGTTVGTPAGGKVLQFVEGFYKGEAGGSETSTPALVHANLQIDIIPSNALNRILIMVHVHMTCTLSSNAGIYIYKDGSELVGATSTGESSQIRYFLTTGYHSGFNNDGHAENEQQSLAGSYTDTAGSSGSPITYDIRALCRQTGWFVNRTKGNGSGTEHTAATSSITLMEIQV